MKKIFLDTNFIVDYLVRDDYRSASEQLMNFGNAQGYKFYISFLSVANFAYILRKTDKDILLQQLQLLSNIFEIIGNTKQQLVSCFSFEAPDFEDALQYAAAIDAGCQCIITRNAKDFGFSKIPVMSAQEYLDKYMN